MERANAKFGVGRSGLTLFESNALQVLNLAYALLGGSLALRTTNPGCDPQPNDRARFLAIICVILCPLLQLLALELGDFFVNKEYIAPKTRPLMWRVCRLLVLYINPLVYSVGSDLILGASSQHVDFQLLLVVQSFVYLHTFCRSLLYMTTLTVFEIPLRQVSESENGFSLFLQLTVQSVVGLLSLWLLLKSQQSQQMEVGVQCPLNPRVIEARPQPAVQTRDVPSLDLRQAEVRHTSNLHPRGSITAIGDEERVLYTKFYQALPHPALVGDLNVNMQAASPNLLNPSAALLLRSHPKLMEEAKLERKQQTLNDLLVEMRRNVGRQAVVMDQIRIKGKRRTDPESVYDTTVFTFEDRNENQRVGILLSETPKDREKEKEILGRFKTSLISSLTHELFTPINQLFPILQDIPSYIDPVTKFDLKEEACASAEMLYSKTCDMIDYTKMELNQFSTDAKEFSVDDLFEELKRIFKFEVWRNHLALDFNKVLSGNRKLLLYSDKKRIKQVLVKLVANAIKHTKTGTITVTVIEATDSLDVVFRVEDTGSGIGREMLNIIFASLPEKAKLLHAENVGTTRLPGLGLTIAKNICDRLGGSISVTSTEGVGSTFAFVVPVCRIFTSPIFHSPVGSQTSVCGFTEELKEENKGELSFNEMSANMLPLPQANSEDPNDKQTQQLKPMPMPMPAAEPVRLKTRSRANSIGKDKRSAFNVSSRNMAQLLKLPLPQSGFQSSSQSKHNPKDDASFLGIGDQVPSNGPQTPREPLQQEKKLAPFSPSLDPPLTQCAKDTEKGFSDAAPEASARAILHEDKVDVKKEDVVLIVDDSAQNRSGLQRYFIKLKIKSIEASDGQEALEAVTKCIEGTSPWRIRLILMDLSMPIMDGLEGAKEIRKLELATNQAEPIPIVAVSAHISVADENAALEAGMQEFQAKPVTFSTAKELIAKYCPMLS